MPDVRVKICGLTRVEDGEAAARAGAHFLGSVLSAGFRRAVAPRVPRAIGEATGRPVVAVLVDESPADALRLAREAGASVLQLHGDEPPEAVRAVAEADDRSVWKAVRPRRAGELLEALERYAPVADGLLVDGWHPELRGGGGVRFPWELLETVRDAFPEGRLLVAAGGLDPDNVAEAVRRLRPDVVDVSSGVEREPGVKDADRVRAFVAAAAGGARRRAEAR